MDITQLLAFSVKNKASDLHLSAGLPPMIRVHGDVRRINVDALDHKTVHAMVYDIMNDTQRKTYEEFLEIDFSFEIEGLARFRVNAFNQNRGAGAVFRTIPSKILTLEQLNAPKIFADLSLKPRGLVLVPAHQGDGRWSAYIDASLGSMFVDEPWLEMAPSPHKQAELLAGQASIKPDVLERALGILQPAATSAPAYAPTGETDGVHQEPVGFLLAIMNDAAVDTGLRIEAAKALLPYFRKALD